MTSNKVSYSWTIMTSVLCRDRFGTFNSTFFSVWSCSMCLKYLFPRIWDRHRNPQAVAIGKHVLFYFELFWFFFCFLFFFVLFFFFARNIIDMLIRIPVSQKNSLLIETLSIQFRFGSNWIFHHVNYRRPAGQEGAMYG